MAVYTDSHFLELKIGEFMSQKNKEINSVIYNTELNVDYLPEEDLYVYKRKDPSFRFNLIGSGMMGQEHMRVVMLEGRATINGIFDRNEHSVKKAQSMFNDLYPDTKLVIYDTLEAACNDPEIDGLIICTPNYSHLEILETAIKSGKPILLEKPMATTIEDAISIKNISENYSSFIQVALQYRYKAMYAKAREEALLKKSLGDIHMVNIIEHRLPFLDKIDQWNKFSIYSGGTLVEKCCHYFDLFNLFANSKPKYVYAVGGQNVNFLDFERDGKKSDILDNAVVVVVYENGIKCNFNLCMFAPMFYEEITICGEKGRIKAYENEDYLIDSGAKTHFEMHNQDHGISMIGTPCYPNNIQSSGHMGGTYFEYKVFIDTIEGKNTNHPTTEEGFWSVVVGAAAEKSVATGEIVYIDELLANYAD